jgi:pilus assembly protein Flp/PilA
VFTKHEIGQGLVEYALILVLISLVSIIALQLLGPSVGNVFSTINYALSRLLEYTADVEAGLEPAAETPPECYGTLLLPIMVIASGAMAAVSNRIHLKPKPELLSS